jgi:hypothetical protein
MILASAESDRLVQSYTPVISEYFRKKGITYDTPVSGVDPFLKQEKCGEKYREYSIKTIRFIKTEKSVHLFKVYCSGFDSCNRVVVTDEYRVKVNTRNNRITHRKLKNGER